MQPMRSLLYVPANRQTLVATAHQTLADIVVLDLESSVPPADKQAARAALRPAIDSFKGFGKTVFVRVNHPDTGLTRDDLSACVGPGLDGIVLAATSAAQDLRDLDVLLRELELHRNVRPGTAVVIPLIETARGLLHAEDIATASTRVCAVALGGEEYAADLGLARSRDGRELAYARGLLASVCAAYALQPLDAPFPDFQDAAGLAADADQARAVGMRGKFVIHPDQIDAVNHAFSPTPADLEAARRVVAAFEEAVGQRFVSGEGEGRLMETPVVRRSRDLIAYAEAIAAISG